jgi:hypothetical protein
MTKPSADESLSKRLQRIADAAEAFSFWASRTIEQAPHVDLADWRVMQVADGSRHLVGTSLNERETGRVSSRVVALDSSHALANTKSGRVYKLHGPPGRTQDADYTWHRWLEQMGSPSWTDVTSTVLEVMQGRPNGDKP